MKKIIFIGCVILFFICSNFCIAIETKNQIIVFDDKNLLLASREIAVDNEGDGNFTTIQEAIDHSLPGDTIMVYSGTYNESLFVNTNGIIIEGINYELGSGNDEGFPIIDGGFSGDVIFISADNVVVKNLIIRNSGQVLFNSGIQIFSDYNTIMRCVFYGNLYGININLHDNNVITENIITLNQIDGILIFGSTGNSISKNNISDNGHQGIFLLEAEHNIISENEINLNDKDGIQISNFCSFNKISDNILNLNGIDGIKIFFHDNYENIISSNTINYNHWNGIHFMDGHDNHVLSNYIHGNHYNGIHFGNSDRNKIIGNTISYSSNEGIFIFDGSKDNKIYYNNILFNNAKDKGSNIWDNGYPLGGNYWTYYNGLDDNGDGIGDTPYPIPGGDNVDRYPIIDSVSPPKIPEKPKGRKIGLAGKLYTYSTSTIDTNNDSIQYGWDWNGDKIVDEWSDFYFSGEICQASHAWNEGGTYFVYVNSRDIRGMVSDWSNGLTVIIPRNKAIITPYYKIMHIHLNLFTFLKIFLERLIKV